MPGYLVNIEKKSIANSYFREILFTGPRSQLVVMSLAPGEEIGMETHDEKYNGYELTKNYRYFL